MINSKNQTLLAKDEGSTNVGSKSAVDLGKLSLDLPGELDKGVSHKTLPPSVVKDIEQKNIARRLAGLSPIVIKVRKCLFCGAPFESAGNRTCGCSSRTTGMIAGREII